VEGGADGASAKTAKLAADEQLRDYVQRRLAGEVRRLDGTATGPPTPPWKGGLDLAAHDSTRSVGGEPPPRRAGS
jgi:hypothetical protein